MKLAVLATSLVAAAVALATSAPANADPDQDFATQLHTYGVYGPRDYNAWIGEITCKRLRNGLDSDAYQSAQFVSNQLHKDSTTQQAWQFLGAAISIYCPDQMPVLEKAAIQRD